MSAFDAVLIYDGECPYCSIAAKALEAVDELGALSWYDEAAQTFLQAQFGATPFAMVLVDEPSGRVYAGRAAAKELADRAGMPGIVGSLVRDNYEGIAAAVGLASGRGRDPDPVHETYRLEETARETWPALRDAASGEPVPA
ncbi:DUF393 domain-containing protein [Halapricum sp. CBA1109]|uniref:DCC1-like thiol-disulfide oxidoreductase family protein n=1 Tax=Halapricum sp. CBA1109 TaxID=2668068 RepID=UPI0012FADD77|nr:DCC1-like thiol-disulfide oxidoreductase family protein [Halapricum sp. CBA1109]MUV90942.1 DUF393 domain-containing protein [Halapricum sp. CBA1109]